MKLPISINENGDVSFFSSVEEAEAYMEPLDVERGEYVVTDADRRLLRVEVVSENIPLLWGLWRSRIKRVRIKDSAL
ncbi:hypothetical protein JNX00_12070 [Hydrogenophaga sp. YM1]|jgi:hypothetical protein|uniref:hypothetical protein n=1 Tax=Hydrogenophaga sp. YM1 TaxID=2806262 RepID=UPI00195852BB|nr:hypothetical protein [Hydrogenophaga sp. YM1]QRR32427.1 hypothetical protein JNX00_12070 [Hydrogenophaga sp. YM1]